MWSSICQNTLFTPVVDNHGLLVRGTGNKQHSVTVGNAAPALDDWPRLQARFVVLGVGNCGGQLTDQAVYNMLRK